MSELEQTQALDEAKLGFFRWFIFKPLTVIGVLLAFLTIGSVVQKIDIVVQGESVLRTAGGTRDMVVAVPGTIATWHVSDGEKVEAGDPVLDVSLTTGGGRLETLQARLQDATGRRADAQALYAFLSSSSQEFDAPSNVMSNLVVRQFVSDIEALDLRALELQARLGALSTELETNREIESLTRSRLEARERLAESGSTSLAQVEQSRIAYTTAHQAVQSVLDQIEAVQIARRGTELERSRLHVSTLQETQAELRTLNAEIIDLGHAIDTEEERLRSATLRAPFDGLIFNRAEWVAGAPVAEGDVAASLVPEDSAMSLRVTVHNRDIGFVELYQSVQIEFEAFPASRYGHAVGIVEQISAEAAVNEQTNERYYTVEVGIITTPENYNDSLRSGMAAKAQIITGERPIYLYFLGPIFDSLNSSMGER